MRKIFLLATLLLIFILPAKVNAAADWVWIYSDDYFSLYIDNNSIGRDNNGFFAYFQWTYSNAGINKVIESRRKNGLSVNGYYNLSHEIEFCYFRNYGGIKYSSIMGSIDYDKNGNIIDSWSTNEFYWGRVIPDTYLETIYNAAYARVRGK